MSKAKCVDVEATGGGPLRMLAVALSGAAVDEVRDRLAVDEQVDRLQHRGIREGGMLRLQRGLLAVDLLVGVGRVQVDEFGIVAEDDADAALAAVLEPLQHLVLDLEVLAEVVVARLQHGAGGRHGVASALELDRVEIGPRRPVVSLEADAAHHVAGAELDEFVGAGADRREVGGRVARLRPHVVGVDVLGQQHAVAAHEGVGPEGRGLGEQHLHGQVVDLLDGDVAIGRDGDAGRGRILDVLPGERRGRRR